MKNIKNHLVYYLSLILSLGTVLGIIACVYFGGTQLLTGNSDNTMYFGIGTIICAILYKIMFSVRTNAREKVEFDEFGNKIVCNWNLSKINEEWKMDIIDVSASEF